MATRYTPAEKRQRAVLVARGARQAAAGCPVDPKIERRLDRIGQAAEERYQRDVDAALRLLGKAKDAVAAARVALRAAASTDRPQAKAALKKAEEALKRAERAAARYLTQ